MEKINQMFRKFDYEIDYDIKFNLGFGLRSRESLENNLKNL